MFPLEFFLLLLRFLPWAKMQQKFLFGCNIIFYSKRRRIWKKICLDAAQKKESNREERERGVEGGGTEECKNKSCRDSCKVGIEKQTKWLVPCHVFWCTPAAFVVRRAGCPQSSPVSCVLPRSVYILFHFVVSSAEQRQKYWGISKNCCTICSKCCCAARVDDVENCQTENWRL